jgi:hypothetical protein
MTIDNADKVSGEIINVNEFQLRVPQQFVLTTKQCTREIRSTTRDSNLDNYIVYTFERRSTDNLKQSYLTVDCSMEISPSDSQQLLGGAGGISQASMVGMANYTYQLKKRISILVNKNPI